MKGTATRALAGAVACLLLAAVPHAQAQDDASAATLSGWVKAVRDHRPGTADRAAGLAASLSYADRRVLNPAMQVFLRGLHTKPGDAKATGPLAVILGLVKSVRDDVGVAPFLRRAAVLHADAAIFHENYPEPPDDAPRMPPPTPKQSSQPVVVPPPLLFNQRLVQHMDGQVVGETPAVWHWVFGRSLLDEVLSGPAVPDADRAFVSDWYHGVAAFLFATSHHGDLNLHLQHAARMLPDDPRLLFDRGCLAETLGLPIYQALSGDPTNRPSLDRLAINVPAASSTDADAERLFRRALEIDPGYAEVRVHLARLLDRRGRHDEAAQEIDHALTGTLDRTASFYGHLFGGRVAENRGRPEDALGHYGAAVDLYPDAQSALLGASHAAMMSANVPAALASVGRLSPRAEEADADPWWQYRFGPGRDANALMAAVWSRATAR